MNKLTPKQQETHFTTRRRVALYSFWFILLIGGLLVIAGLLDDAIALRIEKMGFLITTILGSWVAIVLAYFGASSLVDSTKLKNE